VITTSGASWLKSFSISTFTRVQLMEGKLPAVSGGQPLPFAGILDLCAADWRDARFGRAAEDRATILPLFWEQFL